MIFLPETINVSEKVVRFRKSIVNRKDGNIELSDLLEAGKAMEIKEHRCKDIINDIQQVVCDFSGYASRIGIKESTTDYIRSIITKSIVNIDSHTEKLDIKV